MRKLIQVCGDPTVDWFRIHHEEIIVRGGVYYWEKQRKEESKVRLSSKPGGSAMIYQLLEEMIDPDIAVIEGNVVNDELLNRPKDRGITTTWTVWRKFPNPGFDHHSFRLEKWHEFEPGDWDYAGAQLKGIPDLLIIQDTNLGFRSSPEGWPEVLSSDARGSLPRDLIIQLGQYNDRQKNPLLDRVAALGLEDRTTVITAISDLRSCAVKIGLSLSWEKMMEEVTQAIHSSNCPFVDVNGKTIKYKQVIVTLAGSGVIIVGRDRTTMIFDRSWQEGDFANHFPGQIMGYHACLLGSLAYSWADGPEDMDWVGACANGIKLGRKLHILGYESREDKGYYQLAFPFASIAGFNQELQAAGRQREESASGVIHDLGFFSMDNEALIGAEAQEDWTILEEKLLKRQMVCFASQDPHFAVNECARNIVLSGALSALPDVPAETIGDWSSADRQEIEGVRSVKNAMQEYLRLKKPETPLCVAVFGPPGAGKSFVVKEIAKGLGIDESAQLTFNLSQFESPYELLTAFHQIRDWNLQGKMPLVFWDEFDNPCEGLYLGWLRYFLAPMQDGVFSDQGIARPLGGGIHVFAGATSHSFADFQKGDTLEDRNAKKPDFISRLSAYINIRGINGNPNTVEDRLYIIRRAFILRHYLEIYAPQIRVDGRFNIETGVLDALLRVNKYYHGARSLENLIKTSSLADKRKFELSSLPPDNIIGMHANVKEFNALAAMADRKVLSIGIAGHTDLDPRQTEKLKNAVNEAISFFDQQFAQHYITIYSTLAAGAERLVARQLLQREATRLIAILPLPRDEYLEEFTLEDDCHPDSPGAEMRKELHYWLEHKAIEIIEMPPAPTREAAFASAGDYIAEYSDVLIVLWDGNQDKDSSVTVQILNKAEKMKKPICHIWAEDFAGGDEDSSAENVDKYGEIVYRNFE